MSKTSSVNPIFKPVPAEPGKGQKQPGNHGLREGVAKGLTDAGNKPRPGAPKMGKGGSPSTKRGGK